jgi:hypothetical protein
MGPVRHFIHSKTDLIRFMYCRCVDSNSVGMYARLNVVRCSMISSGFNGMIITLLTLAINLIVIITPHLNWLKIWPSGEELFFRGIYTSKMSL